MIKQSCRRCGVEFDLDEKHPDNGCDTGIIKGHTETSRCGKCPNARASYDLTHGHGRHRVCKRTREDVSPYIQQGKTPENCPLSGEKKST